MICNVGIGDYARKSVFVFAFALVVKFLSFPVVEHLVVVFVFIIQIIEVVKVIVERSEFAVTRGMQFGYDGFFLKAGAERIRSGVPSLRVR